MNLLIQIQITFPLHSLWCSGWEQVPIVLQQASEHRKKCKQELVEANSNCFALHAMRTAMVSLLSTKWN